MIIIFGFGKDYRELREAAAAERLSRKARPRRMSLAALAKWLSE